MYNILPVMYVICTYSHLLVCTIELKTSPEDFPIANLFSATYLILLFHLLQILNACVLCIILTYMFVFVLSYFFCFSRLCILLLQSILCLSQQPLCWFTWRNGKNLFWVFYWGYKMIGRSFGSSSLSIIAINRWYVF